jgi:hypothetical protein
MTAVSSHKPGSEIHRSAHQTWDKQFDFIIYLGPEDTNLAGSRTVFLPAEPFPKIADAVAVCARQPGWSAIINADIHIGSRFREVEAQLIKGHFAAAVSARYQFVPPFMAESGQIEDLGLDFFAADQPVWCAVLSKIPSMFRFGHILWDTWLIGFLLTHFRDQLADLTLRQVVFHPRHPQGTRPHSIDDTYRDSYILAARWPPHRNYEPTRRKTF